MFLPLHEKTPGNVCALLLLYNCSAHKVLDNNRLPAKPLIISFHPNVTNQHQPADMGIVAAMKVGYRAHMLSIILDIFHEPDGYKNAELARARRPRGCKGVHYGGKATILDAMSFLLEVWEHDSKYATRESVMHCWRKSGILSAS